MKTSSRACFYTSYRIHCSILILAICLQRLKLLFTKGQYKVLVFFHIFYYLEGQPLKDRVTEPLPPDVLFGDDVRTFRAIYPKLRDFLNRKGATIPHHSAYQIVCQLAKGPYDEPEER